MVVDQLEADKLVSDDMIYASGICGHISRLSMNGTITADEREAVRDYVLANKPNEQRFTKYLSTKYWTGNTFWWRPISQVRETAQYRINFLRELIKTL